jgi:hypothetical protein
MAKKYMTCSNLDLLKKWDIPSINTTINSRCNRTLCSCGKLVDGHHHKCTENEGKKSVYHSLNSGKTTLQWANDKLYVEENVKEDGEKEYIIYYLTLDIYVNQDSGTLSLSEGNEHVVIFNKEHLDVRPVRYNNRIEISKVKELIYTTLGEEKIAISKYFDIAETLNFEFINNLYEYMRIIQQRKSKLFEDFSFVETHKDLIRELIYSYGVYSINTEKDLCNYLKIPKCMYKFTSDPYYSKSLKNYYYKDVVDFEKYPSRIRSWICYYIENGKFTKGSVKEFLNEFTDSFFDNEIKIDCFIKFLMKNQYLGDNVFRQARTVFNYLIENDIEINETTMNNKYYNYTSNYDELSDIVGVAITNEFQCIKEISGIIAAVKQLLQY